MKHSFSLLALALLSATIFVACADSNGPAAVAKKAISAIQKGDYDTYAATFNLSSPDQKMLSGMAEEKIEEEIADKGGIKSYKITESTIEGDTAQVKVHVTYKDGSEEDEIMEFTKVDGEWKQELNK